jgi:hypothetical protein
MLSTIIGNLFELFGDERGTIGQSHVAGRQLAKERASSGVKEREPVKIEHQAVIGAVSDLQHGSTLPGATAVPELAGSRASWLNVYGSYG